MVHSVHSELFSTAAVMRGDKRTTGISIKCGRCGVKAIEYVGQSFAAWGKDAATLNDKLARKKFEGLGWRVGDTHAGHLCPECRENRNKQLRFLHAQLRPEQTTSKQTEEPPMPKLAPIVTNTPRPGETPEQSAARDHANRGPPMADKPPVLGFSDRRVIFAKLEEVYADEQTGYRDGWTDQKVATDLAVPLAWVRLVREENFGPTQANPQIEALIHEVNGWRKEASALADQAKSLQTAADTLAVRMKSLTGRGEMIEGKLARVEQQLGPRK